MKETLKILRNRLRIYLLVWKEARSDVRYIGFAKKNVKKLKWRLLLLAHSLEKGLSICDNRPDFGQQKAIDLMGIMQELSVVEGIKDSFEYREALSVLKKYKEHREINKLDTAFLAPLCLDSDNADQSVPAGYREVKAETLKCDADSFVALCKARHSIREYGEEYVKSEEIIHAINEAKYAPSACNRQMIKVFFSDDAEVNQALAKLVPGNAGTRDEHAVYLFLCADKTAFDYFEIYQWYLNGGIFAGFLSLAFAANKLASCIYQWPNNWKSNVAVRKLLDIGEEYEITAVMSVGYYRNNVRFLSSARRETEAYYSLKHH